MTMEEVLSGCFAYLNQPPERKKYQRRRRKPLYGNIEPYPHRHGVKTVDGKEYIWVALVTDKRKSKHFLEKDKNYEQSTTSGLCAAEDATKHAG